MSERRHFVPEGGPTVRARIFTDDPRGVTAFMREVLGAGGDDHQDRPAEMRIGDSVVMVSDGGGARAAMPVCLYVYVPDVDAAMERALAAGASEEDPVALMPWGDRRGTVRDRHGNLWQIATHMGEGDR